MNQTTHSASRNVGRSRPLERVTIATLAQTLGLTKGTVSKALNGYQDVSDQTRKRVELEARRLGYQPLSHAQAIRTGRLRALGLVLSVDAYDASRPFLAEFLDGVSRAASAEGWTLTIATANSEAELLTTMKRLIDDHKADGFILPRTLHDDPRIALLNRSDVPFVLFGRSRDCEAYPWYDILGECAMEQAVDRLVGQGHERIGFINASHSFEYARRREEGYVAGLESAGISLDRDLMLAGCHTAEDGCRAAKTLMQNPLPPTAILCATDMVALGVYQGAQELGLEIGSDLSVIAYDGIPEGGFAQPALTTFNADNRKAGERLASLLIAHIRGTDPKELQESARASLCARQSDGPPRQSPQALAEHLNKRQPQGGET